MARNRNNKVINLWLTTTTSLTKWKYYDGNTLFQIFRYDNIHNSDVLNTVTYKGFIRNINTSCKTKNDTFSVQEKYRGLIKYIMLESKDVELFHNNALCITPNCLILPKTNS